MQFRAVVRGLLLLIAKLRYGEECVRAFFFLSNKFRVVK